MQDLTEWPTEEQAAALLGVARKTIMRYIADKKIEAKKRARPGRKAENVCNPVDVGKFLAPEPHIMPQISATLAELAERAKRPPPSIEGLFQSIMGMMENRMIAAAAPPPPEQEAKLWLSVPEAAAFTGLSEAYLRRIVKNGPLVSCRGGKNGARVISRSSLYALGRV